jgi:hypothetical protein
MSLGASLSGVAGYLKADPNQTPGRITDKETKSQ